MFTVDELIEQVPASIMVNLPQPVPPVKLADAVKAGEKEKAAG
jgi:hypothetical protein